ncbi:MAG TPA: agmatinase, partial [Candidatus Bathyarchaeia archaeon]|nr:agmatinase [Candidatus Bathyarchaeia archaeon]
EEREPSTIVFGIPFDSTHSFRPGTRFGPDAIRLAFNNMEIFSTRLNIDLESVNINDIGNTKHTVVPTELIDMTSKITSDLISHNKQIIILGGEHLITYGSYLSFPKDTGYVVFDAHYDLRDEYADTKMSHATYLRRIIEKRGADNIIHVGARAITKEELAFKTEHKIKTITDKDIREGRGPNLIKDAISTFDKTYLSVDLDVLDPSYAPGVGNPETTGITSRELFDMIYAMNDTQIRCMDIVELCPPYDNGITASLAAKIMAEVIAMNLSH